MRGTEIKIMFASAYRLVEGDVPGVSLKGRSPYDLSIPEMKR